MGNNPSKKKRFIFSPVLNHIVIWDKVLWGHYQNFTSGYFRINLNKWILNILEWMNENVKVLVAQLCPILCDPMDWIPPGSSAYGILQARILEWVAIPFFRGSSPFRSLILVSCTAGGFFMVWATRQAWNILVECLITT